MSNAVTVTIAGSGSTSVELTSTDGNVIRNLVDAALTQLGLPATAADKLAVVKNGEDAEMDERAAAGDVVTAAPRVANG